MSEAEGVVSKFVEYLNAGDFTAASDLVADDAVFILPVVGVVEGKAGKCFRRVPHIMAC